EKLDPGALSLALDALSPDLRARPELAGLVKAEDVMRGDVAGDASKLRSLASPEVAWGDVVAIDAAIETGNLPMAKELLDKVGAKDRPPVALRWARWFRSSDRAKEADGPSQRAAAMLLTPAAIVERVLVLLANGKDDDARATVVKSVPQLGALAPWLMS